ncbi:MAG: hypothetical protein U0359_25810 [Byssovorax sp.]
MPDANERKVLIVCVFVAGCITLGPLDIVSAIMLFTASGLLALLNLRITAREQALLAGLSALVGPAVSEAGTPPSAASASP